MVAHAYHFRHQTGRRNSRPAQAMQATSETQIKQNRTNQKIYPATSRKVLLNKGVNTLIKQQLVSEGNKQAFPETKQA